MLKISDFRFEGVYKKGFVIPPECENHNSDFRLVIKENQKVEEEVAKILYRFECSSVGALIIKNKNKSKLIYPNSLDDYGNKEFNLNCLSFDDIDKKEAIELFAEYVNELELNTILILEESKNEENVYDYIYQW